MSSHSYHTYFDFPGTDLNLDCWLRDHKVRINNLASKVDKRTYLRESALTIIFFPLYRKVSIISTHLACLLFNLPCPFKGFND
jgi:hypothetical protein